MLKMQLAVIETSLSNDS